MNSPLCEALERAPLAELNGTRNGLDELPELVELFQGEEQVPLDCEALAALLLAPPAPPLQPRVALDNISKALTATDVADAWALVATVIVILAALLCSLLAAVAYWRYPHMLCCCRFQSRGVQTQGKVSPATSRSDVSDSLSRRKTFYSEAEARIKTCGEWSWNYPRSPQAGGCNLSSRTLRI